jgi:glycosyltransferase involved in cell wall biosynthesis
MRFDIIGHADSQVTDAVRDLGLQDKVRFVGQVPYGECLRRMSASHVLLLVEAPLQEGIFLPSKFVDYVQTGRPILAVSPRLGTVADIIGPRGGGLLADCRDESAILQALQVLHRSFTEGTLDLQYGSGRTAELFSERVILGAYERILARIGVPLALTPGGQEVH